MKYKILITGKATSIIEEFFRRLGESFEIMTTSLLLDDVLRHVKYFQPHLFLYCMYNESREDFNKLVSLRYQLDKFHVYIGAYGSQTDITELERSAVNVSDLILVKPLTMDAVQDKIQNFLEAHRSLDGPEPGNAAGAGRPAAGTGATGQSAFGFDAKPDALKSSDRKHILVVDDDPRMLKTMKELLHGDYDVATAVNGKVAMKFLESKHTDLILLDYEMPDEKGPDVLKKIRANPGTKNVPVIFLTGVMEKEKIQKALVLQPQGYLLKPIDSTKVRATISKVLEG